MKGFSGKFRSRKASLVCGDIILQKIMEKSYCDHWSWKEAQKVLRKGEKTSRIKSFM